MNASVPSDVNPHAKAPDRCDGETRWRSVLRGVPSWSPPALRTVVVVPHPDDEVLGTGGLVAHQRRRGHDVVVVAVTDGEAAYADAPGLAATRVREQTGALHRLGLVTDRVIRLGFPDGHVDRHVDALSTVVASLVDVGTLLVAPWQHDAHPDHEACGRAAATVAAEAGADLAFSLFWAWHRVAPACMPIDRMVRLDLDEDLIAARYDALVCHASQWADAAASILPLDVLGPMTRPFEVYVR